MIAPIDLVLIISAAAICWIASRLLITFLASRGVLDVPVARSSHTAPTPRGGGIAVIGTVILFGAASGSIPPSVLVLVAALALIGWVDDVRSISPLPRFSAQIIAVAVALYLDPGLITIPHINMPMMLGAVIIGICWLWFINLYNFMDGIDGITGVETLSICIGISLVSMVADVAVDLILPSAFIAAAIFGFLFVNWHPAKIFLGDVGSVPLGFVIAWMLLSLAQQGAWIPAIILPMYYLADATITLLRRLLRKEKIWQAHKEHFYQRAHQGGLRHDAIALRILGANIGLIILAIIATQGYAIPALITAGVLTALLLVHLNQQKRRAA